MTFGAAARKIQETRESIWEFRRDREANTWL